MTALELPAARAPLRGAAVSKSDLNAALFAALTALTMAPAFIWPIPRGNDIVNHWARLTLYTLAPDDPLLKLYHIHLGLIPNLGVDLLYLALSPLLSPLAVIRFAYALAIALPALGAYVLHRVAFEKPSPSILIVPFLSYNLATGVGLINFSLGAGIALLGVAYAMRRPAQLSARDVLALNAFGAAVFFCHLIALAMFLLLLGLTLAAPLRAPPLTLLRRAGAAVATLAIPISLLMLDERAPATFQLTDKSKTSLLLAPVENFTSWDPAMQVALLGLVALALASGVRLAPRAWLALPGFVLLALTIRAYWGAATLIDARLKVYVWHYALAVTAMPMSGWRARLGAAVTLAASAATAWRVAALEPAWDDFQRHASAMRAMLAALPLGSRALVVKHPECDYEQTSLYVNMTAFAVIDRHAYVNTLFALSGMQPVAPLDKTLDGGPTLAMEDSWLDPSNRYKLGPYVVKEAWAQAYLNWRTHFTHVIDAHVDCPDATLNTPGLTRIGASPGFDLYEIR